MGQSVYFVSLGCAKNTVDTERMVGLARRQGLSLADDPAQSDVIVVNTCGFIDAAKQESVNAVLEMAEHKHSGQCRRLVVAGCLSQRYPQELAGELPEVDAFLGTADLGRLARILGSEQFEVDERIAVGEPSGLEEALYDRELTGRAHSAYLKISEGCNRPCAFCSIPLMRGRQRSRSISSLVEESRGLVERGVRELILVAQDSTAYGRDLPRGEADLAQLLEALSEIDELHWIRLHYAYPSSVDTRLIEALRTLPRVVPYVDMPIQHLDAGVLRRMRRGYDGERVHEVVTALREALPALWLRTTVLVGHPGETERAHEVLLEGLESLAFDHLGAFVFSAEEGTAAVTQPDPVAREVAEQRRDDVMALQRQVSQRRLKRLQGQSLTVMIDGPSDESEFLLQGRHVGQSPDVDGVVVLADAEGQPGDLVTAQVTQTSEYDLVARQLPS